MEIVTVLGLFVLFLALVLTYLAVMLFRERDGVDKIHHTLVSAMARHGVELTKMEERHGLDKTTQEAKHSEALRKQLIILRDEQNDLKHKFEAGLEEERAKYNKLFSKHKSQQVRMGHVMEKIAPILDNIPVDITNASVIPLFDTVDYLVLIVGNPDESKDGI